jgi:hypothetical protein
MEYERYCPTTINVSTHPHLKNVSKCWQTSDGVYDIMYDSIGSKGT